MKKIILIRHGKSSWEYQDFTDFERPLNERGRTSSVLMGEFLKSEKMHPDLIISSPAVRAGQTSRMIAEILQYPLNKIKFHAGIYDGDESDLMDIIQNIKNKYNLVFLTGHNPDMQMCAELLTGNNISYFPTCCIYGVAFSVKSWKEIKQKTGKQFVYQYPKGLKKVKK